VQRFISAAVILAAVSALAGCAQPQTPWIPSRLPLTEDIQRALTRMEEPYILAGEDIESLYYAFPDHLRRLGDAEFAAQLSQFSPRHVAAVACFIQKRTLEQYPRTRAVLSRAPRVRFPATKITEEDARRS
jgi:hypothetical protein